MMTDLMARLVADAGVQGAVGTEKDGSTYKVYFAPVKAGVDLPFVVVRRSNEDGVHHYGGVSAITEGMVDIDCYAATNAAAVSVADAVRDALDGLPSGTTMGSTVTRGMWVETQSDERNDPGDGGPDFDNFIPLTVRLFYERSVPTPT